MQTVTQEQIKQIHTLLSKIGKGGDKEYKQGLVQDYTNGLQTSTTKLNYREAAEMIHDLQQMSGWSAADIQANKKRRLILSYAHEMMWEQNGAVDMNRVNGWCIEYGYLHKGLNDYTNTELSKLVWQMQAVYKSFLKGV